MTALDQIERIIRPRKRTNSKAYTSKRGARKAGKTGTGTFEQPQQQATGGGIASPLTEELSERTYHEEHQLTSSDGWFVIVYQHVKKRGYKDANNAEVAIINADE